MTADPYLDPRTGLLRNRLGITEAGRLREAEAGLTLAAIQDLNLRILPGRYDLPHLRAFHREIFGDVYQWAGELRTVAIAKTDLFCLPQHIESYAAGVFDALAGEPVDWASLDAGSNVDASVASLRGDNRLLRTMLSRTLRR